MQECDSIGFRYLSIPDTRQHFSNRYRTSFVLQPTSPLIKRISPIGRTPRQRVARENPESWNEPFDTRSILRLDAIRPSFDELRQASFILEGKKNWGIDPFSLFYGYNIIVEWIMDYGNLYDNKIFILIKLWYKYKYCLDEIRN